MKKRRQRRWGLLLAVVLAVLALGAIALLMVRPARVIGVSASAIADSVEAQIGATKKCQELEGGRTQQTVWRCVSGNDGEQPPYLVQADEWGCWEARGESGRGKEQSGCISILDYLDILD